MMAILNRVVIYCECICLLIYSCKTCVLQFPYIYTLYTPMRLARCAPQAKAYNVHVHIEVCAWPPQSDATEPLRRGIMARIMGRTLYTPFSHAIPCCNARCTVRCVQWWHFWHASFRSSGRKCSVPQLYNLPRAIHYLQSCTSKSKIECFNHIFDIPSTHFHLIAFR